MNMLKAATLLVCLGIAATSQGPSTADELIKQVLAGLEAKDQSALARLTISEAEYRTYIWPKISGYNLSAKLEKYYGMHRQGSEAGLNEAIKLYGGQKMEVVKVEPGAAISHGNHYRLVSTPAATVRMADGKVHTISPTGALLEQDGSVKVSTYYVPSRADVKDMK
jgi:hypothetical protein